MSDFETILKTLKTFEETVNKHKNNKIDDDVKKNYELLIKESPNILSFLKNQLKAVTHKLETKPTLSKGGKINYYYEQNESTITIIFSITNMNKKTVSQETDYRIFSPSFELDNGRTYTVELFLKEKVKPKETKINIKDEHVEFILTKDKEGLWSSLEEIEESINTNSNLVYPSSSKKKNNFDRLDYALKRIEDAEGLVFDGTNKGYSQLYNQADEDGRRAMAKSLQESGGTHLNMNWKEVSKRDKEYYISSNEKIGKDTDEPFGKDTDEDDIEESRKNMKGSKCYTGEELELLKKRTSNFNTN